MNPPGPLIGRHGVLVADRFLGDVHLRPAVLQLGQNSIPARSSTEVDRRDCRRGLVSIVRGRVGDVRACWRPKPPALPYPEQSGPSNRKAHKSVKITIDSSEPLEDALRVLGAMYRVDLVVTAAPAAETDGDTFVAASSAGVTSAATRKKRRSSGRTRGSGRKAGGPVSNAELRTWAKQHGYAVADRGRVPRAVLDAYRASQS